MGQKEMTETKKPKTRYKRKDPTKNASTTGGPGKRDVDQTNWRVKMQTSRIKFDDKLKQKFLDEFAFCGRMAEAAYNADVTYACAKYHLDNDPEFMQAFEEAKQKYRDRVATKAQRLIFDGSKDPIVGGKNKDEIIGHKTTEYPNLILAELKRVDPSYTDRQQLDINGGASGVLVAPADMSPEEWIAEQNELNKTRVKPDSSNDHGA
jgi:hypothetical protein